MSTVEAIAVPTAVKITIRSLPLLAAGAFAVACGSSAPSAEAVPDVAAPVRCDAYASPGPRSAQRLADSLHPGQTGCLHGGRYRGSGSDGYVLRIENGGRKGAPITITSAPGERAELHGIVYVVKGANHVTLSAVDIDGRRPARPAASQVGIQLMASHTVIADSDITNHRQRSCMLIGANARGSVIRGNVFHDCGDPGNGLLDHAIYVQSSRRARIVDNVFLRSAGWAVQLYPAARGSYVARNLMWENGGGVVFGGDSGSASKRNLVEGNVLAASRARPELTSSFGGPVGRGNLARGNCLAPGSDASDPEIGYRTADNRKASGADCLRSVSGDLLRRMQGVAPALVARLTR